MEQFYLKDENRESIPIKTGFPEAYLKEYGIPGSVKYHAYFGKHPLLFQRIKVGKYEISIGNYLTRSNQKLTCKANTPIVELHFILSGKVHFKLQDMGWVQLKSSSYNMIAAAKAKNETYFKIPPVFTWDIHFKIKELIVLSKKYPKLKPLLTAIKNNKNKFLLKYPERPNPLILQLIHQINAALMAGKQDHKSTLNMLEQLIIMVLEDKPIKLKYNYDYEEIEKLNRANRLITKYLDEKDILKRKIKETNIKLDKFREGFQLLFGKLPGQFLREKRLEKAYKLATEGRTPTLEDIALLCGYLSRGHLSKVFFKHFGIRISEILQENRKNSK